MLSKSDLSARVDDKRRDNANDRSRAEQALHNVVPAECGVNFVWRVDLRSR
jgi:hypothetical protein